MFLALAALTGCGSGVTANTPPTQPTPVSIQTISLPNGTVGAAYSSAVLAQNGSAPYSFGLTSGSLPAGVTLEKNGVLDGTPTAAGTSSFVVTVTDGSNGTASATLSLKVVAAATPVSIVTNSLPAGTVGAAYTATVLAINGTTPYSFAVTSGTLPAGLTLASGGAITGTPTAAGSSSFTITVTDAGGVKASANFTVSVAALVTPVSITTTTLPSGTMNAAYTASVAATNGTAPYTFAVTGGALPAGLTMASSGAITGTPTAAGPATFTVTVTDANHVTASAALSITIGSASTPVSITTTSLPNGTVSTIYSQTIVAANGTTPYSFAVTGGSLPAGLTLASNGALTGTPTTAGPASFTVTVTDANHVTASASYSITIGTSVNPVSITTASLPNGQAGVSYTASVAATGGTTPYTFSVTGSTPAGLAFSSNGTLAGNPVTPGDSNFTVKVTDATNQTATASYHVTIAGGGSTPLSITTVNLPAALLSSAYSAQIAATGGTPGYSFSITGGALPSGITMSSSGQLSGSTTAAGTYHFTVQAVDASAPQQSATANLQIVAGTTSATVTVDASAVITTVPADFYGLHTSVYDTVLNDTANLPSLLANTGISVLRYPGGGYSDNYHWVNFSVTPFYSSTAPACSVQADGYLASDGDFGTFARLLKATGAGGMITVNYGTSLADANASKTYGTDGRYTCSEPNSQGQPQEAAAWVAYANGDPANTMVIGKDATGYDWKTVGYWAALRAASPLGTDDGLNFLRIGSAAPLGIKYWEIGNEMYYNGWATNHNAETDLHAPYVYPAGYAGGYFNSRDQVTALSPTAYGTNAVAWFTAMKAVDPTIKIGVDFSSPIATDPIPQTWNPQLAAAVCAGTQLDFAIMHYYPGTWKAVQASELLSLPQSDIPNVVQNIQQSLAAGCTNAAAIKVFLTETSPNGALAPGFPANAEGLFTINDYLTALKAGIGNLDWLEMHDGTYLTSGEQPGPSYFGVEMAHQLAAPGDSVLSTNTTNPLVLVWATKKTNGQKGILLINSDGSNPAVVQVTFANTTLGSSATEYTFGVGTTQSGTALNSQSFPVPGNTFNVTVPAYTAVELLAP